jgi:hypothetical protein
MDFPYLSLRDVEVDVELARKLPRRLAYYHLALPLAEDGDQISVVMAHPDNQTVQTMLEMLLGTRIVPVLGSSTEIKIALDRIWAQQPDLVVPRILSWGTTPEQAALAKSAAEMLAGPLSAETTSLDSSQGNLDNVLLLAREGQYSLIVIDTPDNVAPLLRKAPTPVLLLRGKLPTLRRILVVLRGHSPDESVLNWVEPLAKANAALVTLLAVSVPPIASPLRELRTRHSLARLLEPESGTGAHIASCTNRLSEAGVEGSLKLCQGMLTDEIALEFVREKYGLLVIAAEAYGDFVQQMLIHVQAQSPDQGQPVLIVKPIAE